MRSEVGGGPQFVGRVSLAQSFERVFGQQQPLLLLLLLVLVLLLLVELLLLLLPPVVQRFNYGQALVQFAPAPNNVANW